MKGSKESAPALIRTGVYTALGGGLVAGGVAVLLLWLRPKEEKKQPVGGCGCGCGGTPSAPGGVYT